MAGRRVAPNSSERNAALIILTVGSAAALASLFGSIWVVRAGVVVAVAMAVVALVVSFAQIKRLQEEHARELRHEVELRTAAAERHHADSVAMIDRFNQRAASLNSVITQLRSQLAAARSELSTMRGNAAWLRGEVAERQARVEALNARIAELEQQLRGAEEREAEESRIIELVPDRPSPSVEDIWGDDEHPTLVDIRMVNIDELDAPLRKHA